MSRFNGTLEDEEDRRRLRAIFDALDRDGDGLIPLRELERQPVTGVALSEEQKEALLARADRERDGVLDFQEFSLITTSAKGDGSLFRGFLRGMAMVVTPRHQRAEVNSYLSDYSCCPPPLFILIVSLLEVGLFLYFTLSGGVKPGWFHGCGGCYTRGKNGILEWGPLVFVPIRRKEAWRFISYMLVHSGIEHIGGNVVMQLVLGIPLELVHKPWRIAPLYLAGVLAGSLMQYSMDPSVLLVGASGGVYAIITAHLANTILNWAEMPFRWVRLALILLFMGFDVGHAIYRRVALGICERISYAAHIGGALAGLLLGMVLLRNVEKLKWEKILGWISLALFLFFLIATTVLAIVIQPQDKPLVDLRCNVTSSN